jgi:hypothetical protein
MSTCGAEIGEKAGGYHISFSDYMTIGFPMTSSGVHFVGHLLVAVAPLPRRPLWPLDD